MHTGDAESSSRRTLRTLWGAVTHRQDGSWHQTRPAGEKAVLEGQTVLCPRTCLLTWTLLGHAVASHVQVVTRHSWRRSASSGFGRTTVLVSGGHRQSRTMASFTLAVANLCSRRNQHLRSQCRCRSTGSARRRYLRDRTCRLTWTLLGRAVASHVQVVTHHGCRRSASSGFG